MSNEPQLTLTEVHRDAMTAANSSWSETDKLYVSVCSALVALAAIFSWGRSGSEISMLVVGLLLLLLAGNWWRLIRRYRRKILASLKALSTAQEEPARGYFAGEQERVDKDWGDFYIAIVVILMSLFMIATGGWSTCQMHRASIRLVLPVC
jgi:hypothetical protein